MVNSVSAQLLIDGVYTDKPLYTEQGMTVQIGPDPDSGTLPSAVALTFQNPDLSMDPSNVLSPLYGKIGRYTPLKVLVGGTVLANVEATDWEPDRTIGHTVSPAAGLSWVTVGAVGILDRLKLWKEPLRSAMYQQINSYATMLGYWPLEGSGTLLANTTPGPNGLPVGTVNAAGDPGPSGSDTVVQLGSDGAMSFRFLPGSGNGYQVCWVMKVPNVLTATYFTMMSWTTTDGVRFEWQINSTSWNWLVTAPDGTVLVSTPALFGAGVSPLTWTRYRMRVTWSAGTVTVEPAWYPQDASVIYGTSFTYSFGGTGRPLSATVQPNTYTNGAAYGHLFALTNTALDLIGTFNAVAVMNGYAGETAGARFVRLMGQIGIGAVLVGNASDTIAMGPQKPGLVLDLLQECADTDHALLYDDPATPAVTFRTRANRYGQTSKLDLTYNVNVVPPLKKQINPVGVANVVTVTNWSGSSATLAKTAGALSTAVPPAGVGEIRGSVDVNQRLEALLDDRAAWELILSTTDRPRYQQITVDLLKNPSLTAACNALRPGDLITLAGIEPDPILLHVIQIVHTVGDVPRTCILKCVPGDPWNTGKYGTDRYTVRKSSLSAALTTSGTSMVVALTDPKDYWSSTSTGYDIVINGGERVRVTTAFTAPSSVSSQVVIDDFHTTSLDTSKWATPGGTVTAGGTNLTLPATTLYPTIKGQTYALDLSSKILACKLTSSGASDGNTQFFFGVLDAAGNGVSIEADPSSATWTFTINGAATVSGITKIITTFWSTWTANDFVGITMIGTTLYAYKSTGGTTWTEIGHCTVGGTFTKTAVAFQIASGELTGSVTWAAIIDDVSTFPQGGGASVLTQTATVTRSINGVVATHAAGDPIMLYRAPRYAFTPSGSGGLAMVAGGDVIAAGDINRVRPNNYYSEATSVLAASSTGVAVPGISITFTTATANAEITLWWSIRADPTAASATAIMSARPLVTGPSAFSQSASNFAVAAWAAGAAGDVMSAANSNKMTLGAAGSYTVTLIGTTGANEQIGLYSQVTAMVQEVAP